MGTFEGAAAELLALLCSEGEVVVEIAVDDALRAVREADVQVARVDHVDDLRADLAVTEDDLAAAEAAAAGLRGELADAVDLRTEMQAPLRT